MNNVVHSMKGEAQSIAVANIAEEESDPWVIAVLLFELVLLEFIS